MDSGWRIFFALGISFCSAELSFAGAWDYIKDYQLGVDKTISRDVVEVRYETDGRGGYECQDKENEAGRRDCKMRMTGGSTSGWGLFIQKAFKRQGDFHFEPGVGINFRILRGAMSDEQQNGSIDSGLPLQSMEFNLLAAILKPSIKFGITPKKNWPDFLFTIGPAIAVATGNVSVNGKRRRIVVGTLSGKGLSSLWTGFFETEIVFWRFWDGALSMFASNVTTGGEGTQFFEDTDGMENIKARFSSEVGGNDLGLGYGLKLVLPFP